MMNMPTPTQRSLTFRPAFEGYTELQDYGNLALALFALKLYLRLDDIDEFAATAITEGGGDKKVDIFHLDLNERRVVIAQSYQSTTWGKKNAPSNKASDLNTAMAWLLSAPPSRIPPRLRSQAVELRKAISEGTIDRIEVIYVHNCYESKNVEDELKVVANATIDKSRRHMVGDDATIQVTHKELGLKSIENLYQAQDRNILVDAHISIKTRSFIVEKGKDWKAILTSVPGNWIRRLHKKYGDRLFSANYRDYMSFMKSDTNINYGIIQAAQDEPDNFWVYNNGITALTHEIVTSGTTIQITGVSIINGAQTTGALGDARQKARKSPRVPIRFVECKSPDLVDKIIRYNNTQNEIKPFDRRSKDSIQVRLGDEFGKSRITYIHRRAGIRCSRSAIVVPAIAPALAAFHGDPQTAHRNAKEIFLNDIVYNEVFPPRITAEHIFLVRALSTAIDDVKRELKEKVESNKATSLEQDQFQVLKFSGSKHFIHFLVGFCAEEIMSDQVPDLFGWKCNPEVLNPENHSLTDAWKNALHALFPHIATFVKEYGKDAFYEVPRSMEKSKEVAAKLKASIASLASVLSTRFDDLRSRSKV